MQARKAFFNDVLSRCDSIHDFTKARSVTNMKSPFNTDRVYFSLDSTNPLKSTTLVDRFKTEYSNGDIHAQNDFKSILQNNNPDFYFLKSYATGPDIKRTGFEPSVVQFFEHHLSPFNILDEFYLLSSKSLKDAAYIDYEAVALDPNIGSNIDNVLGSKVCVMNLGNSNKDSDSTSRDASGIFVDDDDNTLNVLRDDLKTFFGNGNRKLRFVVDASIVRNEVFHDPRGDDVQIAHLACSEWDSATKSSIGLIDQDSKFTTFKDGGDIGNRVLYKMTKLDMEATDDGYRCAIDDVPIDYKNLPREVGNIILCAQGMNGQYDAFTKATGGAFDNGSKKLADTQMLLPLLFDIKRSGDGCQVLEILEANKSQDALKYILLTNDHLAFLKARMNQVPCVFTKKNTSDETKLLFCINDVAQSQAGYLVVLQNTIKAEVAKLVELTKPAEHVEAQFDKVIQAFDAVKEVIMRRCFLSDEYFMEEIVLPTISTSFQSKDLSDQQRKDLSYICKRLKVYFFDFLLTSVDLRYRKRVYKDLIVKFEKLRSDIENDPIVAGEPIEEQVKRCQGLLFEFQKLRARDYGAEVYNWCADESENNPTQKTLNYLKELSASSQNQLVELAFVRHFDLNDEDIMSVLNFRPTKIYTKIWNFLKKGFATIAMAKTRMMSLRGKLSTGESAFVQRSQTFISKHEKSMPTVDKDKRQQIDHVRGLDSLYKELVFDDFGHNFNYRFARSNLINELTKRQVQSMQGGGPDDMDDENDDETYHLNDSDTSTSKATNTEVEDIEQALYTTAVEEGSIVLQYSSFVTVDGFKDIVATMLDEIGEPEVQVIRQYEETLPNPIAAENNNMVQTILPQQNFVNQRGIQLINQAKMVNSVNNNQVTTNYHDNSGSDDENGNIYNHNQWSYNQNKRGRNTSSESDSNKRHQYGGAGNTSALHRLLFAMVNDNVEIVVQTVVIAMSFIFLNAAIWKQGDLKSTKQLAANVLWNSALMLVLIAVGIDANVYMISFALYLIALGSLVVKYA